MCPAHGHRAYMAGGTNLPLWCSDAVSSLRLHACAVGFSPEHAPAQSNGIIVPHSIGMPVPQLCTEHMAQLERPAFLVHSCAHDSAGTMLVLCASALSMYLPSYMVASAPSHQHALRDSVWLWDLSGGRARDLLRGVRCVCGSHDTWMPVPHVCAEHFAGWTDVFLHYGAYMLP